MILADTSIWVDHLRGTDADLVDLLNANDVLMHPFVLGELALGRLRDPGTVLATLAGLPAAEVATEPEVIRFIATHRLAGLGIGYVDAHLLAATRLTPDASLWTRDRRLAAAAQGLGLRAEGLS